MSKQVSSKKINIPTFLSRHRKIIIGAVAILVIAVVVLILVKDNITNVDIEDTTYVDMENDTTSDFDGLREVNAKVESNEQIIYIAPKDLYIDDNIVISVTSHVDNQLYGQGIRFDYRNKSLEKIEVAITTVEDNETLDSNKTIVEPGITKTHVFYIGLEAESFTEGTYIFTITTGENSYKTESLTVKTK